MFKLIRRLQSKEWNASNEAILITATVAGLSVLSIIVAYAFVFAVTRRHGPALLAASLTVPL